MADAILLNYPDVLGLLTQDQRFSVGDQLQAAMAVQPKTPQAGQPFYAIVMLQNMTDAAIDVAATFRLPDGDSQKGNFTAAVDRAVVTLKPAEVGYIRYPINLNANTPTRNNYKLGVQFATRLVDMATKALPVRAPEGGATLNLQDLTPERVKELKNLKSLEYSVDKGGGFLRKNVLELAFKIEAGRGSATTDKKPFWKSLWTLADLTKDAELGLLRKYADDLKTLVPKKITRMVLFEPLMEKVDEGYKAGGFTLTEVEKRMVTRSLMAVLQYMAYDASDKFRADKLSMPVLDVMEVINREDFMEGEFDVELPNWLTRLLMTAENEKKAIKYANHAIIRYCYDDLVRDAILLSFTAIEHALQEDLGSHDDMVEYGEHLILALNGEGIIDYTSAYMPLIIGGVLLCDWVLMQNEKIEDVMDSLPSLLDDRYGKVGDDHIPMYEMTERVVKLMRVKYGYPVDL